MVDVYTPTGTRATTVELRNNLWWTVAAVGIGLALLAHIIAFFDSNNHDAADFFGLLGYLAVVVGLTLAALFGAAASWGARAALMIAAAFLAVGFGSFPF